MRKRILVKKEAIRDGAGGEELFWVKNLSEGDIREVALGRVRDYWLRRNGWLKSALSGRPFDSNGDPIPWITYSCLRFLQSRVQSDMSVFEYGSGHSTLWWSPRVATITSCEHSEDFFNEIKPQLPTNVDYLLRTEREPYVNAANESGKKYDVLFIDGVNESRPDCMRVGIEALNDRGVVLCDNSEREAFQDCFKFLSSKGFRRVDFWGHGPIWVREWQTSILYRDNNCLGL